MPGAVLDVVPRHVAELEIVGPCQDTLDRPLGQLAGVVLQLVGQHRAALRVQLLSPVDLRENSRVSKCSGFVSSEWRTSAKVPTNKSEEHSDKRFVYDITPLFE